MVPLMLINDRIRRIAVISGSLIRAWLDRQDKLRPLRLGTDFICDRAAHACDRALGSAWVIDSRRSAIDAENALGCRVVLAISLSHISISPVNFWVSGSDLRVE